MVKNPRAKAGDAVQSLEHRRIPGIGNDTPLQSSGPENPVDRGAWWATSMGSQRARHD